MFNLTLKRVFSYIKNYLKILLSSIKGIFWPPLESIKYHQFLFFYILVGLLQLILGVEYFYYYINDIAILSMSDVMPFIFLPVTVFNIYFYIGKSLLEYRLTTWRLMIFTFNTTLLVEFTVYIIYIVL